MQRDEILGFAAALNLSAALPTGYALLRGRMGFGVRCLRLPFREACGFQLLLASWASALLFLESVEAVYMDLANEK